MKKMLFVNGTYNDIPLVGAAHRLGCYVITSGNDPGGEAHAVSDEYCPCDYSDLSAVLQLAREKEVDAICSCGNDLTALAASYASEQLGLPGHDRYDTCRLFHEKDEFKKLCACLDLPTPRSHPFTDLRQADAFLAQASFPVIVKPVDLGGGKGISVARSIEEGRTAAAEAFRRSISKHIVIEDYIQGTQHGFICYIKDGRVAFDYSTNDYSYLNPFMVWMGSGYPADGYASVRGQIIGDVEKMAAASGMADGFLTIQYMMSDGKPYYIETMRRCLGNMHFKCLSRDLGIDMYELYVATELGLDCSQYLEKAAPQGLYSGFMGIYARSNGVIREFRFDEAFEKTFFNRLLLKGPGGRVTDYMSDKLGMVWFSFDSQEQRQEFLLRREELFSVEMDD